MAFRVGGALPTADLDGVHRPDRSALCVRRLPQHPCLATSGVVCPGRPLGVRSAHSRAGGPNTMATVPVLFSHLWLAEPVKDPTEAFHAGFEVLDDLGRAAGNWRVRTCWVVRAAAWAAPEMPCSWSSATASGAGSAYAPTATRTFATRRHRARSCMTPLADPAGAADCSAAEPQMTAELRRRLLEWIRRTVCRARSAVPGASRARPRRRRRRP